MPPRKKPPPTGAASLAKSGHASLTSPVSSTAAARRSLRKQIREPPSPSDNAEKSTPASLNSRGSSKAKAPAVGIPELPTVPEASSSKKAKSRTRVASSEKGNSVDAPELPTAYSRGRGQETSPDFERNSRGT